MARLSFKRGSPKQEYSQLDSADQDTESDTETIRRDKEIVHHSSSGVESYSRPIKSSKCRRSVSGNTTTSEGTSSALKITPRKRKRKSNKIREARIEGPDELTNSFKMTRTNYGSASYEERRPILDNEQVDPLEAVVVGNDIPSTAADESVNTEANISTIQAKAKPRFLSFVRSRDLLPTANTERFCSLILCLLLPLIAGLTLIISVHVNSDRGAREVNPSVFHYYSIGLISVFFFWYAAKYLEYKQENERAEMSENSRETKGGPLIPSHLLNGLALFGVSNSVFQIIKFVDFIKCSKNVSGLDKTYVASYVFESVFVFCQIHVFYTLSRKRRRFGNYFTMFTLAINLTLWADYFCRSAVNHRDLDDVKWLRRNYYGLNEDLCARSANNTGRASRDLDRFVNSILPYSHTFAMEYSLLASALLLHLWLGIATPSAGEFGAANTKWDVWRFGFILGLFTLPIMAVVGVYSTVEFGLYTSAILSTVQLGLYCLLLFGSILGLTLFNHYYTKERRNKALGVDLILLCFSSLGFLILDMFTIFATYAVTSKETKNGSYSGSKLLIGVTSVGELVTVCSLTAFITASYFYRLPLTMQARHVKAAKYIRQIASLSIMVSFGFWAMRTYTFRSTYYFDWVGWQYFGKTAWFAITQFSTPLCIFYHFHCAVCLSRIVAESTVASGE